MIRIHSLLPAAIAALALGCASVASAQSTDAEVARLQAQVAELSARLEALEAREQRAAVQIEDLGQQVRQAAPPTAVAHWTDRLQLSGDFRFRNEWIDAEAETERTRQRVRARFGAEAAVTDNVSVHVQAATGGLDPRSANQTLGDRFSTKDLNLNLAYLEWAASDEIQVLAGKMKNPVTRPRQSRVLDSDLTPEGFATTWNSGNLFLLGAGFWGVERALDDDTVALLLQAGYRGETADGRLAFTAAASYMDWINIDVFAPLAPLGNTVASDGTLVFDYDLLEGYVELSTAVRSLPLSLFAQYNVNTAADDEDTAYGVGALLGKAAAPGTWQIGYSYHDHEKDSLLAQFVDSNFGAGLTDARGHVITGGYVLGRNITVELSYFANTFAFDGEMRDYDRVMLDLSVKY